MRSYECAPGLYSGRGRFAKPEYIRRSPPWREHGRCWSSDEDGDGPAIVASVHEHDAAVVGDVGRGCEDTWIVFFEPEPPLFATVCEYQQVQMCVCENDGGEVDEADGAVEAFCGVAPDCS